MASDAEVKQLLLKVDASTELARRQVNALANEVARASGRMDVSLARTDTAFARVGTAAAAARNLIGGFIGGIGISGVIQLSRATLQFADDLDAAAVQAGVGVERYQTLKEGLRKLELTTEQTDKVLNNLRDTLGQVQSGTAAKGVVDALDRMGVTARIMNGEISTSDGLLDAIAESATGFATEAQFTASVVDVLGRKVGVDLAAALGDGGKALHAAEEQLRATGQVITTEMVQKLADANESLDAFAARARTTFTIFAADAVTWFGKAEGAIQAYMDKLAAASPFADPEVAAGARKRTAGRSITSTLDAAKRDQDADRAALDMLSPTSEAYKRLYDRYLGMYGEDEITVTGKRKPAALGGKPKTGTGGASAGRTARPSAAAVDPLADFLARSKSDLGNWADDLNKETTDALAKIGEKGVESFHQIAVEAGNTRDFISDELQEALDEAADHARALNQDLASGLADVLVYGRDLGDVLVGSIKRAAAALIESNLLSLLGGKDGGGGIGGLIGAGLGAIFGKPGGGSGARMGGARAAGGPVSAGGLYLVGERGPEIFAPRVPGHIIPNGGMGGVVVNMSIAPNFSGNAATRQEVVMMGQIAKQEAIAGVREAMSRRGSWR